MSVRRYPPPEYLIGAGEFSAEAQARSPLHLIATMRATGKVWQRLRERTTFTFPDGRPRMPGDWLLAFLAFVLSREVDVQPWHGSTGDDIWRAAGFQRKPSYPETWLRFGELEQTVDALIDAIGELVQEAKTHDPAIGRYLAIDSTEAASHARLHHDCGPDDDCARRTPRRRHKQRFLTISANEAGVLRNEAIDATDGEDEAGNAGHIPEAEIDTIDPRTTRIRLAGCWWRTHDPQLGLRAYTDASGRTVRAWLGTYHQHAVDHRTGLRLMVIVEPASHNETDIYPALMHRLDRIGAEPLAITADRGFAVTSVFERNTRHKIASIIPLRRPTAERDDLRFDRHGVPRCPACGGETVQTRFDHKQERGGPRIWYRCRAPVTPGCWDRAAPIDHPRARERSISCSHDWRRLVPLSRLDPLYHELAARQHNLEHAHRDARTRHRASGKDTTSRPKRRGTRVQELRALTAVLSDWLLYGARMGYRSGKHAHRAARIGHNRLTTRAGEALRRLLERRHEAGLDVPYGPQARRLHLGLALPPSARGRPRSR